jgi:cytochrome c553
VIVAIAVAIGGLAAIWADGSKAAGVDGQPPAIPVEQVEFFEKRIRPLLVERCYECHADDASGGLQLDTAAAVKKGGEHGPVIVPGKPVESRLMKAVRREKGMEMPPDEPLSEEQVADLAKWIEMGAPDPRTGGGTLTPMERLLDAGKSHWSFQPVSMPPPPEVKAKHLVRTPIDAFVQARLEERGWSMSPRADARTLVRRASLDLVGLPPQPEQVAAFASDASGDAFDRAVAELLASPRYGERWGRHWLDVARYADGAGGTFNHSEAYPYAWTYRDYVIRAFNEDKPFDRFVVEQLAADLAAVSADDNAALAALGFVTVGRRPNARVDDEVIDDRIDVISRGLLGLTVSCARCHDHKLEPIPTTDYYGLYGILKSCTEPTVYPALKPQPASADWEAYKVENRRTREHFIRVVAFEAEKGVVAFRNRVGDYLLAARDGQYKPVNENNAKVDKEILKPRELHSGIYWSLVQKRDSWLKGNPAIFRPWLELAEVPDADFASKAPELCKAYAANTDGGLHKLVAAMFAGDPPQTIQEVAQKYTKLFAMIDKLWGERFRGSLDKLCVLAEDEEDISVAELEAKAIARIHKAEVAAPIPEAESQSAVAKVLMSDDSPFTFVTNKIPLFPSRDVADGLRRNATAAVNKLTDHPGAPIRMMAVQESGPFNAKVLVRGNPQSPGADAPRQYLTALRAADAEPFPKDQSGRRQLAELIASPSNPLTSRVIVNRVWAWHFGQGLVRTPSDFGLRGEPPTHPELLDWLAARFVADGWSLKKLHMLIMQSHVYQQASAVPLEPAAAGSARVIDADNRLLWRYPTRAVEFEVVRDAMLAVGGTIDLKQGGKPFDVADAGAKRRTVYAKIDRKNFTPVMRIFDVPEPTFSAAGRSRSALAPQALWLFNSPFTVSAAKALAGRVQPPKPAADAGPAIESAVRALWQAALQRPPSPTELARAIDFVAGYPEKDVVMPQADDWTYGFGDYSDAAKKVENFTSLSNFVGAVVKGQKVGAVDVTAMELTPDGGKVAAGKAAVRRWTSPEKGRVRIDAELIHLQAAAPAQPVSAAQTPAQQSPAADAPADNPAAAASGPVVCRIVHGRHGVLGEWQATAEGVMTRVNDVECEVGDTIDFVAFTDVDPAKSGFIWSPTITMPDREMPSMPGMPLRWDARHDFLDPKAMPAPLSAWEELAQILLVSGEFVMLP